MAKLFLAMAAIGAAVLLAAGDQVYQVGDRLIYGSWMAIPAAIGAGCLLTALAQRGKSR